MADVGRTVARRSLGWALVLGFCIDIVGILAQAIYDIVSDNQSPPWLRNSFIGLGALLALGKLSLDISRARSEQGAVVAHGGPPTPSPHTTARPPAAGRGRTVPALVGLLIVLALCGAGGVAVSWAATRLTEFATTLEPPWADGDRVSAEPGVQRLGDPVTEQKGTMTVIVTGVEVNSVTTAVTMTVRTSGGDSVLLPRSQLSVPGAATLRPALGKGNWSEVPAGGEMTGTIVYEGALGADVTSVTLAFTDIFGGLDDPKNMSIVIPLSAT